MAQHCMTFYFYDVLNIQTLPSTIFKYKSKIAKQINKFAHETLTRQLLMYKYVSTTFKIKMYIQINQFQVILYISFRIISK